MLLKLNYTLLRLLQFVKFPLYVNEKRIVKIPDKDINSPCSPSPRGMSLRNYSVYSYGSECRGLHKKVPMFQSVFRSRTRVQRP